MTRPATPGKPGVRYIIRGGAVMTMDPGMLNKGEFAKADVLVEGNKIMAVGPNLPVAGATQIDARAASSCPASAVRITISSRRRCGASSPTEC